MGQPSMLRIGSSWLWAEKSETFTVPRLSHEESLTRLGETYRQLPSFGFFFFFFRVKNNALLAPIKIQIVRNLSKLWFWFLALDSLNYDEMKQLDLNIVYDKAWQRSITKDWLKDAKNDFDSESYFMDLRIVFAFRGTKLAASKDLKERTIQYELIWSQKNIN